MSIHVCQHIYPQTWNLNPNKIHCPANAGKYPVVLPSFSMATFAMENVSIDIQGTNLGMSQLQTRLGSPGFFQKTDPGSLDGTRFGRIEEAANVWQFWGNSTEQCIVWVGNILIPP